MDDLLVLYWSLKEGNYFLPKDSVACTKCGRDVCEFGVHNVDWKRRVNKRGKPFMLPVVNFWCRDCFKHFKNLGVVAEFRVVLLTHTLPSDAVKVLIERPQLESGGGVSVFDVSAVKGGEVVDRTRFAGRESFADVCIGDGGIVKRLEFSDTSCLTEGGVDEVLEWHGKASPVLGGGKSLEDKRKR